MRGPQGQWRPVGAGALAAHICKIATGEIEETYEPPEAPDDPKVVERAIAGGKARAAKLSATKRSFIAKKAAKARWSRAPSQSHT